MLISPFKPYKWEGISQYKNNEIGMSNPFNRQLFIIPKNSKQEKQCRIFNNQNDRKYRVYSSISCNSNLLHKKQKQRCTSSQKISKQFQRNKQYYLQHKRVDLFGPDVLKVKNGYNGYNVLKDNHNEDYYGKESKLIDDKYLKTSRFQLEYETPRNLANSNKYKSVMLMTSSPNNKQNQRIYYHKTKIPNIKSRCQPNVCQYQYGQRQNQQRSNRIPFGMGVQARMKTSIEAEFSKLQKLENGSSNLSGSCGFRVHKHSSSSVHSPGITEEDFKDFIYQSGRMGTRNYNNFNYNSDNGFPQSSNSKDFYKIMSNTQKSSKETKQTFLKRNRSNFYPSVITYQGNQYEMIYL